jgi:4-hydroxybenzoate polyprenyltransferase/phosphoserine phosphatase
MAASAESLIDEGGCPALVVDLDGTLVRSDLLVESAFAFVGANPHLRIPEMIGLLARGKAVLKAAIAAATAIDVANLPYDERVVALIASARAEGRKVYLASARNERYVEAVAAHVGAEGWFASTSAENLSSHVKARRLVEAFGEKGFDYVGNDRADLVVWAVARRGVAVAPSRSVRTKLAALGVPVDVVEPVGGRVKAWVKLIRVHQWAKNGLVFVALLTAQKFDAASIAHALGAFLAFSFAASAVYIQNDLVDVEADRKHPSKRRRPLAAGTLPISAAMLVAFAFALASFGLAAMISPLFAAVLFGYLALAMAYTFYLKRKMLVDVVVLASLYTMRVIGGAMAISVSVSEWLLAFSMFIFTSLALIKRYIELAARVDTELPDPTNRNYRKTDLNIVATLAAAAGFNAVTVFALYISSDTVHQLYRHPSVLWLACPILMYWLGRCLLLAHRRLIDDDPIVFALSDWNSWLALGLIAVIMVVAA